MISGYAELPDMAPVTTTVAITEQANETVNIVRNTVIPVTDGLLDLRLTTEAFPPCTLNPEP